MDEKSGAGQIHAKANPQKDVLSGDLPKGKQVSVSKFRLRDASIEAERLRIRLFLMDLNPSLENDAHRSGLVYSHVNHLGKPGQKDWELKPMILGGDWIFITNNSVDFWGPYDEPGSEWEYADVCLHAGIVCINAPGGLNLDRQRQLFGIVLDDLRDDGDLMNQILGLLEMSAISRDRATKRCCLSSCRRRRYACRLATPLPRNQHLHFGTGLRCPEE